MHQNTDTIFALSTGALPSGIAVVRLSGPHTPDVITGLSGGLPVARTATLTTFSADGFGVIDRGLLLYFPSPSSFTGEDCAELHLHGGRAVVAAMLDALTGYPGLRHAEPGEFTRRAFLNGKIDLTATEALADLIAAETESQRRLSIANHAGAQRVLYESWRAELLALRSRIEATLDFSDEGDVSPMEPWTHREQLDGLAMAMGDHLESYRTAEIVRDGYRVALIGPPNVGKSSLLNALARRDVAIVTDIPGTTRDLVEVQLDLAGHKVILTDTAGLRESTDPVEMMGIERAVNAARSADLIISMSDGSGASITDHNGQPMGGAIVRVRSKADLGDDGGAYDLAVSSVTGSGIDALLARVAKLAGDAASYTGTLPSRRRHVDCLRRAQAHIIAGRNAPLPELRAEELRMASDELGSITGIIGTEELLGAIFSEFCIGK